MTEEDESWEGENKYYANLALNGAFAKIEQKLKAYAAPHSPVAQMSGDSFANSLRKIFTIARNMDDDKVKETFHDHWQIWQDALASHPSNAAKHCDDSGQPYAPCTREDDAALSILAMLCTRMGIDQTLPADERAGKLSEMLAATVPQVAQSVPEGWKLVPVEPTDDMARAAIAAHFENKMQINGLNYWSAMLKAAPQPVAASPSIVPSDEQIKACAISVTRDIGRPYQDCTLAEWARKLAHALTTASNAGEAAQEPAEDSDTPHQEAEIVIEVSTLLDAPTLYTQVFIAARCMNGWPHDAATEAATIAVKEYGDDPCKEVAALRAVLDEVLRTDESGEAAQGDRQ